MISSALFINVAESMVTFGPHVPGGVVERLGHGDLRPSGRRCTCETVPPLAVSTTRRTSSRRPPCKAWNTALCSLSTRQTDAPSLLRPAGLPAARPRQGFPCWPTPPSCRPPARPKCPAGRAADDRRDHNIDVGGRYHLGQRRRPYPQLHLRAATPTNRARAAATGSVTTICRGRIAWACASNSAVLW